MRAIVVLVECEYEENLGLIARAMKNFGLGQLLLVRPKADRDSGRAESRAMHAKEILRSAAIHPSLKSALRSADFSAATTSVSSERAGKGRKAITPKALAERFKGSSARLALVFGRESSGLTNKELEECDFVVSIPAHGDYPALNVSHAAAVLFYELSGNGKKQLFKTAGKPTKNAVIRKFSQLAAANQRIRDRKTVTESFRRIVSRAPATEKELRAITGVISESLKKIKK